MRKLLFATACVLSLSACVTSPPPVQILPDMTFQHLQAIPLQAARLTLHDKRQPYQGAGTDVSLRFPTSPAQALQTWAQQRLHPSAPTGQATFTLLEARAVEESLVRETGLTGLFTTNQSERYRVTIKAQLDVTAPAGVPSGQVTATATRFITVPEDASLFEREQAWYELVEQIMVDFDTTMEKNIREKLR